MLEFCCSWGTEGLLFQLPLALLGCVSHLGQRAGTRGPPGHAVFVLPASIPDAVNSCGCNFLCLAALFSTWFRGAIGGGALGLPRHCLEQVDAEIKGRGECRGAAADSSLAFSSPAQLTFSSSGLSFQSQPHSWFLMNFQLISGKSWSIFVNSPAITWLWSFTLLSAFLPTHLLLNFSLTFTFPSQQLPSLFPVCFPCHAQHSPPLPACLLVAIPSFPASTFP